jgi:hypothetical protein
MPPEFSSRAALLAHYKKVHARLSAGLAPPPPPPLPPPPPKPLSSEALIVRDVAEFYGLRPKDILGARRNKGLVIARQVAMCLAHELTKHSYPQIGRHFHRDHTTVMHSVFKIQEQVKLDQELAADMAQMRESILPQLEAP